jgi:hypothetical protein
MSKPSQNPYYFRRDLNIPNGLNLFKKAAFLPPGELSARGEESTKIPVEHWKSLVLRSLLFASSSALLRADSSTRQPSSRLLIRAYTMHVSSSTVLALLCALHCANTASSYSAYSAWRTPAPAHAQSQRNARLSSSGSRLFSTEGGGGPGGPGGIAKGLSASELDNAMVLTLASRGAEVFAAAGGPGLVLSMDSLLLWEKSMAAVAGELRQLKSKDVLLKVYTSILTTAAPQPLNPLQSTSFQMMTNVIMERLLALQPPNSAVTELIDDLTDVHLSFVELFQKIINDGDGEDG